MGWTYFHKEKGVSVIDALKREFPGDIIIDLMNDGPKTAYAALQLKEGKILGVVFLLDYRKDGDYCNFGYKDISEDMGPYECKCPERILKLLSPEPFNQWSREWREKCWLNVEKKKNQVKIKTGQVYFLKEAIQLTSGYTLERGSPLICLDAKRHHFNEDKKYPHYDRIRMNGSIADKLSLLPILPAVMPAYVNPSNYQLCEV